MLYIQTAPMYATEFLVLLTLNDTPKVKEKSLNQSFVEDITNQAE